MDIFFYFKLSPLAFASVKWTLEKMVIKDGIVSKVGRAQMVLLRKSDARE